MGFLQKWKKLACVKCLIHLKIRSKQETKYDQSVPSTLPSKHNQLIPKPQIKW